MTTSFPDALSRAVYYNKYSRWNDSLGRREMIPETMNRGLEFLNSRFRSLGGAWLSGELDQVYTRVHALEALPSMRLVWSAGPALARNHVAAYNCSFMAVNRLPSFREALFILMSGTGVGYSVEEESVAELPRIKKIKRNVAPDKFVVPDTTEGWCDALDAGIEAWWNGLDVEFDYSQVRPAGVRLVTKGGRASGPEPLKNALTQIRELIRARAGRNPTTILVHDIMCLIAQVVVVGGIRRASLISLSSLDDLAMRGAKHGAFWNSTPWRAMANNSVAYEAKPTAEEFMDEWLSLIKGKSGERGIFNREAWRSTSPRRKAFRGLTGTNPCGEINLRDEQFCNLSEIVCRADDNRETLVEKVRVATILGTIQASLTDFKYLNPRWKKNCEEEALLGVSATGQMDCPAFRDADVQRELQRVAIEANADFAKRIGINPAAATTCVKPSGTASLLVGSSSGQHTRWSKFYIRRIRLNTGDPMLTLFESLGMTITADPMTPATWVVDFPVKAPEGSITRKDLSAPQQLEYWKSVKTNFCEHNPSATIYVKESEWLAAGNWVFENWDLIGGLSFLPSDDHVYPLAPYESITEAEYNELVSKITVLSDVEFAESLASLESDDNTTGHSELSCVGGVCEIAA